MRRTRPATPAVVVTLLLAGCSGSGDQARTGASSPAAPVPSTSVPTGALPPSPAPSRPVPAATSAPATASAAAPQAAPQAVPQATVPARPVRRLAPVPLQGRSGAARPAEVGTLRVDVVEAVPVVAAGVGPGEVSGEQAVAFTVRWSNSGAAPVPLDAVVVDLTYGDQVPASPVGGSPSRAAPPSVAAGSTATGVYVFAVPLAERRRVELTVRQGAALPTAVFTGPAL